MFTEAGSNKAGQFIKIQGGSAWHVYRRVIKLQIANMLHEQTAAWAPGEGLISHGVHSNEFAVQLNESQRAEWPTLRGLQLEHRL